MSFLQGPGVGPIGPEPIGVESIGVESITGIDAAVDQVVTPDITWAALLPLIILFLGGLLLLTVSSLLKGRAPQWLAPSWTIVTAVLASLAVIPLWAKVQGWDHILWWDFADLWWQSGSTEPGPFSTVAGAFGVDGFSLFVTVVIAVAVVLTALFLPGYLRREELDHPDLYSLLLLSAAGGVVMAAADDLIVMFLGLETLSIAVYVLAASHLRRADSQEAGFKYFILGGFSSAFLLYGIALVYGATGSTNLATIRTSLSVAVPSYDVVLLVGLAFLLVGLGFKVGAVPFHSWSPDVYEGSPSAMVVYMASAVKVAGFAALMRVFIGGFTSFATDWQPIVYALAVLSLVIGSVVAIVQSNVKRMLAYSSIAHAGFILIAVEAATDQGVAAALFYLAAYTFMVTGSFGVVALVGRAGDGRHSLEDYKGLSRTNPVLAALMAVFLFAQAGVPFTVGFVAKFEALVAAVTAGSLALAVVAMLSAVVAAFLYLRIVVAMYMADGDGGGDDRVPAVAERVPVPRLAAVALGICALVTVGFGIAPGWLTDTTIDAELVIVAESAPAVERSFPLAPLDAAATEEP